MGNKVHPLSRQGEGAGGVGGGGEVRCGGGGEVGG